ncbi:MAG TPA: hypothetical protein VHL98_15450 [Microvirga sp.]|jgi:hypothetical protein|nr:hypothetical protein [Microvirga sp.]
MSFQLRDVGLECFTLVYRGEDVGSVFSTEDDHAEPWVVSLQERRYRTPAEFPPPFTGSSHRFATLQDLAGWLGVAAPRVQAAEAAA